jgi:UDP-N-acetylmuramoyl-tripeptide--D-alanyl-D-alanine ligase
MNESLRSLNESYPRKRRVAMLGAMKELGADAEKFHFHLGVDLGRFNFEKVVLMGEEMKSLQEGALSTNSSSEKFVIVDTHEEAAKQLAPLLNDKTVVLFKGSWSNRLEKVIELLMKKDS